MGPRLTPAIRHLITLQRGLIADWQARTFTGLAAYAPPLPADIRLTDELADGLADDPDAARAHIAALRAAGLL